MKYTIKYREIGEVIRVGRKPCPTCGDDKASKDGGCVDCWEEKKDARP